jgi:diguanylate cyclase (GGDEF)-like protein
VVRRAAQRPLRGKAATVRTWPLWSLPPAALAFVLAVDVAAGLAAVWAVVDGGLGTRSELVSCLALVAAALVCVEVVRRIGETTDIAQDLMAVWTLPIGLLFPPVYAVAAPVLDRCWTQLRVRPSPVYRRVFTTAGVQLALLTAGRVFHALAGSAVTGSAWAARPEVLLASAAVAGACCATVTAVLVATAVRLTTPETRWLALLLDADVVQLAGVEVCGGVVVTALVAQSPLLILAALPPMMMLQRSLSHAQLRAAARTDTKTGLLNAGTWHRETVREIARAARGQQPLSILLIDVDHFKAVNDTHSHLAGDDVLAELARLLEDQLRPYDILGRFGGEEFVATLPDTGGRVATAAAERLRRAVAEHPFSVGSDDVVHITVSIGVASEHGRITDPTELLAAADAALYEAKAAGRNRVMDDVGPI